VAFLGEVEIFDYQCKALERLIALKPEGAVELLQNLYLDSPPSLGRYAFEKLIEREDYDKAGNCVQTLLGHFDRNPETYAWTVHQILKKKWPRIIKPQSDFTLLVEALHHLEKTRQRYDSLTPDAKFNRHVQSQLRAIFTGDKFSILAAVIDEISPGDSRHLHNSLLTSPAFIGSVKEYIDNVFRRVRADIFKEDQEDNKPKIHYCTVEQLKMRQEELRRIKTIEIPRNTKDIERARGHGDLSENAEYDAAKDRQVMLFKQMEQLQDLIVRARVISPENVQSATISIGTGFEVRNLSTGEKETYILLGMWEAEPDKNIISYLSPLGQEFLGKKLGDILATKTLSGVETRYEILSIRNALMEEKKTV
jgi:transcription elongation factor GreA